MPPKDADSQYPTDVRKLVDFRIPLHWILSGVGTITLVLIGMWFTIGQMSKDMSEVQASLKVLTAENSTADREVSRLQWRMDTLEQKLKEVQHSTVDRSQK